MKLTFKGMFVIFESIAQKKEILIKALSLTINSVKFEFIVILLT